MTAGPLTGEVGYVIVSFFEQRMEADGLRPHVFAGLFYRTRTAGVYNIRTTPY